MKKPKRNIISRRQFGKLVFTGSAYTMLSLSACRNLVNKGEGKISYVLSSTEKKTLALVQDHLFPSTINSPGAKDIYALSFFSWTYADKNFPLRRRKHFSDGIKRVEEKSNEIFGKAFEDLSLIQREKTLREVEKSSEGKSWISNIITNIFEALLSDPAYKGNVNEIGWKWLQHRAGYPRPTANKIYQKR